jgi:hypothetical protein
MGMGELARRAGVSAKAGLFYGQLGLVVPVRRSSGYREATSARLPCRPIATASPNSAAIASLTAAPGPSHPEA